MNSLLRLNPCWNSSGSKGFSKWSSLMAGMANGGACRRYLLCLRRGRLNGIASLFTFAMKSSGSNFPDVFRRLVSLTEEMSLGSGINSFFFIGRR